MERESRESTRYTESSTNEKPSVFDTMYSSTRDEDSKRRERRCEVQSSCGLMRNLFK